MKITPNQVTRKMHILVVLDKYRELKDHPKPGSSIDQGPLRVRASGKWKHTGLASLIYVTTRTIGACVAIVMIDLVEAPVNGTKILWV